MALPSLLLRANRKQANLKLCYLRLIRLTESYLGLIQPNFHFTDGLHSLQSAFFSVPSKNAAFGPRINQKTTIKSDQFLF